MYIPRAEVRFSFCVYHLVELSLMHACCRLCWRRARIYVPFPVVIVPNPLHSIYRHSYLPLRPPLLPAFDWFRVLKVAPEIFRRYRQLLRRKSDCWRTWTIGKAVLSHAMQWRLESLNNITHVKVMRQAGAFQAYPFSVLSTLIPPPRIPSPHRHKYEWWWIFLLPLGQSHWKRLALHCKCREGKWFLYLSRYILL